MVDDVVIRARLYVFTGDARQYARGVDSFGVKRSMRTGGFGFPGGRITVIVVFMILTGVIATIARRFHPRYSALAYITLTLIPLSIASLFTTTRTHHGVIDVLGHWEGVSWLTAVVAVAAGLVGSVDTPERTDRGERLDAETDWTSPDLSAEPLGSVRLHLG